MLPPQDVQRLELSMGFLKADDLRIREERTKRAEFLSSEPILMSVPKRLLQFHEMILNLVFQGNMFKRASGAPGAGGGGTPPSTGSKSSLNPLRTCDCLRDELVGQCGTNPPERQGTVEGEDFDVVRA